MRRVFGPSRKEIWNQLSTEIGAADERAPDVVL